MELRDKVARVMYDDRAIQMGAKHPIPWEYTIQQDIWLRQADAAIATVMETMREPTDAMLAAGDKAWKHGTLTLAIWQDMLSAFEGTKHD